MDKVIYVYIDTKNKPQLVGRLWTRSRNNRESASFEYDRDWLNHPERFSLEPALMLVEGVSHTPGNKSIFGAFGDSAPGRWGRVLMRRAERQQAEMESRVPNALTEADYLLMVSDIARQGALRFSLSENSPFLSNDDRKIPPLVELPKLFSAATRLNEEKETVEDILLLLAPGSSLGGARPKASIVDHRGNLLMAKFPHKDDEINTVLWEALALTLASKCEIETPRFKVENIGNDSILLLHRFDRINQYRVPYQSAMSMLGANDNEQHSYLEITDAIKQYGSRVNEDLAQLWRRIIFNILISNTDDHLRNHGFLYENQLGWRLSPAFDLNPVPVDIKPRILSTTIDLHDATCSTELALSVIDYFNLNLKQAKEILKEVSGVVSDWKITAKSIGIKKTQIDRMVSAFNA